MRARFFSALSALIFAFTCLTPVSMPGLTPAFAGNDEESQRDREEQRQQREEAKRQREEAKRQREEAKRQREEAKRQREEERAQREAARQEAQRQREAQRAQREQESSVKEAARYETKSSASDDGAVQREVTSTRDNTARDTSTGDNITERVTATQRDGGNTRETTKSDGREDGGRSRSSGSSDDRDDAKRTGTSSNKDDKKKDDSADSDEDEKDDVAITPEEPEEPRTLVDWFKQIGSGKKTPAESSGSDRAIVKATTVTRTAPAAPSKSAVAKPASKPVAANAQPASTAYNGVKISGFDSGIQQLGEFRKRQILVGGLDDDALRKAEGMGFKTIAVARTPADKVPVRTLTVPGVMSEQRAQHVLQQALPQARLGPNSVYRLVPAADESGKSYPAMRSSSEAAEQCAGPDCLAQAVIGWHSSLSSCAQSVRIGVIDTSFDMSHPALKGRSFRLEDFRTKAMDFKDDWHGTAVLSVLAGDAQSSTPGLVPAAQFVLASTFGADSSGQASADALAVLAALSWLDGKADIINMSFSGPRNEEIELAIGAMAAKGVIFVAAAGNRGPDGPASFPAAYPQVVAVTAVSRDKQSYRHATHGSYVDVAAPGVNIYTALPRGQAGLRTGTSFAAPFITGLIAAMPAARRGVQTKEDLLARITKADLGPPGRDPTFGEGLPIAPSSCDEIGGVASLPWSPEAKRISQPKAEAAEVSFTGSLSKPAAAGSAMGTAFGFAP